MSLRLVPPAQSSRADAAPNDSLDDSPEETPRPLSFAEAYTRFSPYVARVGQRVLGRHEDVKDLVQDVFLAARGAFPRLLGEGAIRAFLGVVTVRLARRRLRRARLARFLGLGHASEAPALDVASPEDRALVRSVYAALETVPVDQRVAWTLRYIEGAQLEEVARLCRCSLATAKRWIAAAHAVVNAAVRDE